MKITRTTILLAATVAMLPFASLAEDKKSETKPAEKAAPPAPPRPGGADREARGKEMREKMAKELGLSEEQKKKVDAIWEEQRKKGQELRNDASLSQDEKRTKGRELMESTQKKVKDLLTPEQQAKYDKKMEELREQFRNRPQGGGEKKPQ